jgi:DNA-binding transcriptional MerR regulator|tara:strand:- start:740 stop:934 length:195 start_codon:yes stop_codon:yes gene_type:complete
MSEHLLSTSEVLKLLNIPVYKLDYLFKSQRLKPEDFATLGTGQRVYKYTDLVKIKEALLKVESN